MFLIARATARIPQEMLRQPFDMKTVVSSIHRSFDPVNVYPCQFMVHGDGKELWFVVVELLQPRTALHQIHVAIESNGAGTGGPL
jgi:hypothetical protein